MDDSIFGAIPSENLWQEDLLIGEFKVDFGGRFGCDLDVDLDLVLDTQKRRNLGILISVCSSWRPLQKSLAGLC